MDGRGAMLWLLTAVVVCPSPVVAQAFPKSPVHVATNAIFYLCPSLVRSNTAPEAEKVTPLGLEANSSSDPTRFEFKATDRTGSMMLRFDTIERRCTLHYAGTGYEQIAGIVRDVVVRSKLARITGGDKDGAKADVFEGPVPADPSAIARFIIIENYRQPSAAISYTERAK
jgi:hypothetical protein